MTSIPHYSTITREILLVDPITPSGYTHTQPPRGILRRHLPTTTTTTPRTITTPTQSRTYTPVHTSTLYRQTTPPTTYTMSSPVTSSYSCYCCSGSCIRCLSERRRRQEQESRRHRHSHSHGHSQSVMVLNVEPERPSHRHRQHETRYVEREVRKIYYNRWGKLVAKTYTVLERV